MARGMKLKASIKPQTIKGTIRKGRLALISFLSARVKAAKTDNTNKICEVRLPTKITVSPKIMEASKAIGKLNILEGLKRWIYIIGNSIRLKAVIENGLPAGLKAIFLAKRIKVDGI